MDIKALVFDRSCVATVHDYSATNGYMYMTVLQGATESDTGHHLPARSIDLSLDPARRNQLIVLLDGFTQEEMQFVYSGKINHEILGRLRPKLG